MQVPTSISLWRWCSFRDGNDNKKEDYKVTSRVLKLSNNVRNASLVAYTNPEGGRAYGEVQFFFNARLPVELQGEHGHDLPNHGNSDSDTEDETTGTVIYHLAYIWKIPVELECEDRLVKKLGSGGAHAVILADSIRSLIGILKVQDYEYLTGRFTSIIGRM